MPGQSGVGAPLPNPTGQSVDGQGWPVAFDVLPGNTADVAALSLTIARFRERFRIRRAVVVADRGMLGQATLAQLRDHVTAPFDYILGGPLRRERTVAEEVLGRPGRYQQVADNLEVEEVRLGERRYIVCRNPIEAKQDAADRAALLTKLRQTLPRRHPLSPAHRLPWPRRHRLPGRRRGDPDRGHRPRPHPRSRAATRRPRRSPGVVTRILSTG